MYKRQVLVHTGSGSYGLRFQVPVPVQGFPASSVGSDFGGPGWRSRTRSHPIRPELFSFLAARPCTKTTNARGLRLIFQVFRGQEGSGKDPTCPGNVSDLEGKIIEKIDFYKTCNSIISHDEL